MACFGRLPRRPNWSPCPARKSAWPRCGEDGAGRTTGTATRDSNGTTTAAGGPLVQLRRHGDDAHRAVTLIFVRRRWAFALGQAVELQDYAHVVGQQRDLDPAAQSAERERDHRRPQSLRAIGCRLVQGQDDGAEPALADRLRLSEGDWLGLVYLSTVLDDFSRYIVAWKLCTTMKAEDVTPCWSWLCRHRGWTKSTWHIGLVCYPPGRIARNEGAVGSGAAAYLCLVDGCSKSLGSCSLEAESRAVTGRPVVAERGSARSGD